MPNLPYKTAGWDTHSQVALYELDFPLFEQGVSGHYTILRTYEGPSATHSAEALDTADATFGSAYLVRQTPLSDIGGGCVRYQRLYSTIPASWSDIESFAYTYPGYAAGAVSAGVVVNGITQSGANLIFTTATSSGAVAGDSVSISVQYTRNSVVRAATFTGLAVATTNSSQVTLVATQPGSGAFSSVSGTAAKLLPGVPAARALVVPSRVVHDYALTSEANINTDLPLIPVFSPLNAAGELADVLAANSIPTSSDYRTMVANGTEIVAESWRGRYMGNIYVRKTRMIPAR